MRTAQHSGRSGQPQCGCGGHVFEFSKFPAKAHLDIFHACFRSCLNQWKCTLGKHVWLLGVVMTSVRERHDIVYLVIDEDLDRVWTVRVLHGTNSSTCGGPSLQVVAAVAILLERQLCLVTAGLLVVSDKSRCCAPSILVVGAIACTGWLQKMCHNINLFSSKTTHNECKFNFWNTYLGCQKTLPLRNFGKAEHICSPYIKEIYVSAHIFEQNLHHII